MPIMNAASVLPEPVGAWMSTWPPFTIAGQPSVCAGVGPANARSNHLRVAGEKASSASISPSLPSQVYYRTVPEALYFTDSDEANELIAREPLALLIGFALDQQITVQTAFSGPLRLKQRVGALDASAIASMDPQVLEDVFRQRPAIHRF